MGSQVNNKKKKITVHSLKRKRNSRHFLGKLAGASGSSSVEEGWDSRLEAADRGKPELDGGQAREAGRGHPERGAPASATTRGRRFWTAKLVKHETKHFKTYKT